MQDTVSVTTATRLKEAGFKWKPKTGDIIATELFYLHHRAVVTSYNETLFHRDMVLAIGSQIKRLKDEKIDDLLFLPRVQDITDDLIAKGYMFYLIGVYLNAADGTKSIGWNVAGLPDDGKEIDYPQCPEQAEAAAEAWLELNKE